MSGNFGIATTLRSRVWSSSDARLFKTLKEEVLGTKYSLSLTFIGSRRSKKLNNIYRGKNKPTNVLSFPLSKASGEILIDMHQAKREYRARGITIKKHITWLFIHGLLHLEGHQHGDTMSAEERRLLSKFVKS